MRRIPLQGGPFDGGMACIYTDRSPAEISFALSQHGDIGYSQSPIPLPTIGEEFISRAVYKLKIVSESDTLYKSLYVFKEVIP